MFKIDDIQAVCFDLDGTIYLGNEILPGVIELIEWLQAKSKKVVFITNSSTQTRVECQEKLQGLGIHTDLDRIFTSAYMSALYFSSNFPNANVYIVGEEALRSECKKMDVQITANPLEATHLLIGLDRSLTYDTLNQAVKAARYGAELVVTNPDPICPVPNGFVIDTLAIARAIAVAAEKEVYAMIGKPSVFYGEQLLEKLMINHPHCLVIGDRLETDILLGKTQEMPTCLVLTGVSKREDIQQKNIHPDLIVENLDQFMQYINR